MDSEDIKPSKLELEQVFGIFGCLELHYWLCVPTLQYFDMIALRFSPRSRLWRRLQCCTIQTGCSRLWRGSTNGRSEKNNIWTRRFFLNFYMGHEEILLSISIRQVEFSISIRDECARRWNSWGQLKMTQSTNLLWRCFRFDKCNGLALNVPSNRQTTWPLRLTRNRLRFINLARMSTQKGSQSLRPLWLWWVLVSLNRFFCYQYCPWYNHLTHVFT